MTETYTFVRTPGPQPTIYLTENALERMGGRNPGRAVTAHGTRRVEAAVVPILEPGRTLPVSEGAADALGLVDGVPYRLRWADGELRIGPVIGIHVATRLDAMDLSPGSMLHHFLLRYPDVGGLLFLFATDGIDLESETIEGFAWVPDPRGEHAVVGPEWERARKMAAPVIQRARAEASPPVRHPRAERFQEMADAFLAEVRAEQTGGVLADKVPPPGRGRFVRGRFPFPSAIWRRNGFLPEPHMQRLLGRMGPRIFNARFFDKEEGYRLLAADPTLRTHLPQTEVVGGLPRVFTRLEQEGRVILKRQEGNSGYGMMRLERDGDGYLLRFREGNGLESFETRPELEQRLQALLAGHRYLLQQCIDLPEYLGRPADFRVMMQKDDRGLWVARGILGRFGRAGSIVTNFINSGYALPAEEAMCRAFGMNYRAAHMLKADLVAFATSACQVLDRTGGAYGDLGLDVAIDQERRFWLFEVNKLPFHELPLYMGDEQMYLAVKSGPLLYGAHLAGFGR